MFFINLSLISFALLVKYGSACSATLCGAGGTCYEDSSANAYCDCATNYIRAADQQSCISCSTPECVIDPTSDTVVSKCAATQIIPLSAGTCIDVTQPAGVCTNAVVKRAATGNASTECVPDDPCPGSCNRSTEYCLAKYTSAGDLTAMCLCIDPTKKTGSCGTDDPCYNKCENGKCFLDSTDNPICVCDKNYLYDASGLTCTIDPCYGKCGSGDCIRVNFTTYKCRNCGSGTVLKEDGLDCIANPCINNDCNGGLCVPVADDDYVCKCEWPSLISVPGNHKKCYENLCDPALGACADGTCVIHASTTAITAQCLCPSGMQHPEELSCVTICNDQCTNGSCIPYVTPEKNLDFVCDCGTNTLRWDQKACYPTTCTCNGGTCEQQYNQEVCTCPATKVLISNGTCVDIIADPCESQTCPTGSHCVVAKVDATQFVCIADWGYQFDHGHAVTVANPCEGGTAVAPVSPCGDPINKCVTHPKNPTMHYCLCGIGYLSMDQKSCTEDPCKTVDCGNGAVCGAYYDENQWKTVCKRLETLKAAYLPES